VETIEYHLVVDRNSAACLGDKKNESIFNGFLNIFHSAVDIETRGAVVRLPLSNMQPNEDFQGVVNGQN
jgi:hypothetical protein